MCKPQRKLHEPLTHTERMQCLTDTRLDRDIARELGVHKEPDGFSCTTVDYLGLLGATGLYYESLGITQNSMEFTRFRNSFEFLRIHINY
jgi:hypothetical protein